MYNIKLEKQYKYGNNMKKTVNLSLDHRVINLLSTLAAKNHVTKTKIMEEAIEMFAEKKLKQKSSIISFSGSLKKDEGLDMLNIIQSDRRNKDRGLEQ